MPGKQKNPRLNWYLTRNQPLDNIKSMNKVTEGLMKELVELLSLDDIKLSEDNYTFIYRLLKIAFLEGKCEGISMGIPEKTDPEDKFIPTLNDTITS